MTRAPRPDERPEAGRDVPGFGTWRSVYLFVFGWFVLVVLLTVFTGIFSFYAPATIISTVLGWPLDPVIVFTGLLVIVSHHRPFVGAPRYATYQLHPDHHAMGFAVLDAVYFRAPGPLYYPEERVAGLAPHRVRDVWLIMGDHHDEVVDVTRTFERKVEAVRAHGSQWGRHPHIEGFLRQRAEQVGRPHGIPLGAARTPARAVNEAVYERRRYRHE